MIVLLLPCVRVRLCGTTSYFSLLIVVICCCCCCLICIVLTRLWWIYCASRCGVRAPRVSRQLFLLCLSHTVDARWEATAAAAAAIGRASQSNMSLMRTSVELGGRNTRCYFVQFCRITSLQKRECARYTRISDTLVLLILAMCSSFSFIPFHSFHILFFWSFILAHDDATCPPGRLKYTIWANNTIGVHTRNIFCICSSRRVDSLLNIEMWRELWQTTNSQPAHDDNRQWWCAHDVNTMTYNDCIYTLTVFCSSKQCKRKMVIRWLYAAAHKMARKQKGLA